MVKNIRTAFVVLLSATQLALPPAVDARPAKTASAEVARSDVESQEVFSPDGAITRVQVPKQRSAPPTAPFNPSTATVIPVQETGPASERFNLVYVGDGYTGDELETFHSQVVDKWEQLTSVEPFSTYRDYFNVWEVNIVSPESGLTNDPEQGVIRSTALGMYFSCAELERLLCVDQDRAAQYAALAPGVDQIIALGNTEKYGGSGGGVATAAAGNDDAGQIVVHELGHSMGGLADEYDYPYQCYDGSEPAERNVSIYSDDAAVGQPSYKWFRWLGEESPDGGVVGSYDGARFYAHGINRPTEDSIMRTLGHPLNLPGREAVAEKILSKTNPVTTSPEDRSANGPISLALVEPVGRPHEVRWYLDDAEVTNWAGKTTVDPADLVLAGDHQLSVVVTDTAGFVLDPNFTATVVTRSWTLTNH